MKSRELGPNRFGVIYLDYQSTTPCDPRVLDRMIPYFCEKFGNPHSRGHKFGWEADEAVEEARRRVASIIRADPKEIVFTSGATESNNLALKGVMRFYGEKKNHLVTCLTEHKCVLDTARHLEKDGYQVTYVPVQKNGIIDLDHIKNSLTNKTAIVSVMMVNNEIGVIQPIREIGAICREKGVFFHTDAAQAIGKIPVDVNDLNIDLLSLSGHKMYGPKGIGALYIRRKPRVRVLALINGGGQERGMRSGTLSPPLCVGLGEASRIAEVEMETESARLLSLRNYFYKKIRESIPDVVVNGDVRNRIPGNLNISFSCVEGEGLMMGTKEIAVSSGSACTSASLEPSYVLRALGVDETMSHTSIRFGFGRFTTLEDTQVAAEAVIKSVNRLREMSPLWEMVRDGVELGSIDWSLH